MVDSTHPFWSDLIGDGIDCTKLGSTDDDAYDEIIDLFITNGDPTNGLATQLSSLFVNQKALVSNHTVCGKEIELQAAPGDLRIAGVSGCVIWNGSVVLSAALQRWCDDGDLNLTNLNILELGSGTGLLAATLSLLGSNVVATDQYYCLKLLTRNVEANDLIYNEAVTLKFVETLTALCSKKNIPAIVCIELRTQEVQLVFIEALLAKGGVVWRLGENKLCEEVRTDKCVVYLISWR
jgi:hypothetical protein